MSTARARGPGLRNRGVFNRPFYHRYIVVRRLQELAPKKPNTLYVCFIEHTKAYDAVDRTLLGTVFTRFSVS